MDDFNKHRISDIAQQSQNASFFGPAGHCDHYGEWSAARQNEIELQCNLIERIGSVPSNLSLLQQILPKPKRLHVICHLVL